VSLAVLGCGDDTPTHVNPPQPCDADCVVARLEEAYRGRDFAAFAALHHPDFQYVGNRAGAPPVQLGLVDWLRLHQRLLVREDVATDPPPPELWLVAIDVAFTRQREFEERRDLYGGPAGLDSLRWQAIGAPHRATVFLQTQGDTHYQVELPAELAFAVDRRLDRRDPAWVRIVRWEDGGEMAWLLGVR
jgi:hypothetical protein